MTLAEDALNVLADALPALTGGQVEYRRGDASLLIDAAFGRSDFAAQLGDTVVVEHTDRDFIFKAESLQFPGADGPTAPLRGDLLISGVEVFEVLAPPGVQVYRACDPYGIIIRVHTKKKE